MAEKEEIKCKEKCRWKAAILILCGVGLFKEFRPSAPFLVDYAVDHKNITAEEMTHEVLPATTISYIVSLVLLLLVTDALCYKPIIIMGSLATVGTWVLTIWFFEGVKQARLRQFFYGYSVVATEVAYYTYMYANIEKKDYKVVTSYTHSVIHFGQFLSGLIGQALLSFGLLQFDDLNYLSLSGAVASLLFAAFLPRIFREAVSNPDRKKEHGMEQDSDNASKPMNSKEKEQEKVENGTSDSEGPKAPRGLDYHRNRENPPSKLQKWREAPRLMKENFIYTYTDMKIIKWTMWWVLAYGLYIQVDLYVESLWKEIEHHSHQKVWNGAVHASHAIISVVLGLIVGRTKMCWMKWGCLIFGVGTVLQGIALLVMSQTHDLYIAYAGFIVFQTFFQVLIIISRALVAESIREGSEAFIFGMNTLMAVIVQAALTFLVIGKHGFRLDIRSQYIVYGCYAICLGIGFFALDKIYKFFVTAKTWKSKRRSKNKVEADQDQDQEKELKEMDVSPHMPYSLPREH